MFQNKAAIIIGSAQDIGKCIAEECKKNDISVCVIDKQPNDCFTGNLAEEFDFGRMPGREVKQ